MGSNSNGTAKSNGRRLPVLYNCSKCPAYCCSYDAIVLSQADIKRLARFFGISYKQAELKFTKIELGSRSMRHKKDHIFEKVCQFLDTDERRCTIYEARPHVCRVYPESRRCGYYDFLSAERRRQADDEHIPSA